MHVLHRVLVYRENLNEMSDEDIKWEAESDTDEFFGRVFDYRSFVDDDEDWTEYPKSVIRGKEPIIEHLKLAEESQKEYLKETLGCLANLLGEDNSIMNMTVRDLLCTDCFCKAKDSKDEKLRFAFIELDILADVLLGHYTFEQGFYDSERFTSKITEETYNAVEADPDNFAIVLFDYHN